MLPVRFAARPHRTKTTPPAGNLKRRPRQQPGEVAPEKSSPSSSGPARAKRSAARLLITFDGNVETDGIGKFDATSRPQRVDLAREHPDIKLLLDHRDQKLAIRSLYMLAVAIYCNGLLMRSDPELPFEGEFGQQIAKLLAMQDDELAIAGLTGKEA